MSARADFPPHIGSFVAKVLLADGHSMLRRARYPILNAEADAATARLLSTASGIGATCLRLPGGTGYMCGSNVESMARDARVQRIVGGATEVMLEEVAKRM